MPIKPVNNLGLHRSSVRCYGLSVHSLIRHLESTQKLGSLTEIQEVVEACSEPNPLQEQAVIFVHKGHLPGEIEAPSCDLVAFSRVVYLFKKGLSLPRERGDQNVTQVAYPGFPLTLPVPDAEVVRNDADSFGVTEAKEFLGKFTPHAGRIIFLSLHNPSAGRDQTPQDYRVLIELLCRGLACPVRHPVAPN